MLPFRIPLPFRGEAPYHTVPNPPTALPAAERRALRLSRERNHGLPAQRIPDVLGISTQRIPQRIPSESPKVPETQCPTRAPGPQLRRSEFPSAPADFPGTTPADFPGNPPASGEFPFPIPHIRLRWIPEGDWPQVPRANVGSR